MCNLSAFLTVDVIEYALAFADVPTLRALKGVSLAWRARARRVLCARLCTRVGLPLSSNLGNVTTLDLSGSRAAGRLFADAVDAACGLPNLARVTGLGGFKVDVAKLNKVMPSIIKHIGHQPKWPMTEVCACIEGEGDATKGEGDATKGEGDAPIEVLFAAFALRTREAGVPACAFLEDKSITSMKLPAGLTSLGEYSFYKCRSLTSIALPASLTRIDQGAFSGCISLTTIALPASVTILGPFAFYKCERLTTINLPAGLTSIGAYAFYDCFSLTSIALPASTTDVFENALAGCPCLWKWRHVHRVLRSGDSDTESDSDGEL